MTRARGSALGALMLAALLCRCAEPPRVGEACAHDTDCSGGDAALCLTAADVYPKGYCSRLCAVDADCGVAAFCETNTGTGGLCVALCSTSADCRATDGYQCYAPDSDAGRMGCLPVYPVPDAGPQADGG